MSRQIIKQPDGNWCMFSTIIDDVIVENLTKEEMVNYVVEEKMHFVKAECEELIEAIESGGKPYFQFQMDYSEMKKLIKEIHG